MQSATSIILLRGDGRWTVLWPKLIRSTSSHFIYYTVLSKKMDGIWNRYNLKSTGRIYTFGVLKYSEKFKVLDLP